MDHERCCSRREKMARQMASRVGFTLPVGITFLVSLALIVAQLPCAERLQPKVQAKVFIAKEAKTEPNLETESSKPVNPLRDIHIAMIGDSLMRYQYLSLAYRLRYGVWFDGSLWYYNLVNERSFRDPFHDNAWGEFMFHTNRILQPNEVCDCRRAKLRDKSWSQTVLENRYFYDPVLNNSLVYVNALGHQFPLKGRLMPNETRNQTSDWHASALRDFKSLKWEYTDWADVVKHHIRHLDPQPRQIIMNAGFWQHNFGRSTWSSDNQTGILSNETENLLQVIKEYPQYEFVWKTTTYNNKREPDHARIDRDMCDLLSTCLNTSFTQSVRRTLYLDRIHFLEPVYRVTNEQMLDLFGYLSDGYNRMNVSEILERDDNSSTT